jgi:hypothetical protein
MNVFRLARANDNVALPFPFAALTLSSACRDDADSVRMQAGSAEAEMRQRWAMRAVPRTCQATRARRLLKILRAPTPARATRASPPAPSSSASTAAKQHIITDDMAAGRTTSASMPMIRDADDDSGHASTEDAARASDVALALGEYLFALPDRVRRGHDEVAEAKLKNADKLPA